MREYYTDCLKDGAIECHFLLQVIVNDPHADSLDRTDDHVDSIVWTWLVTLISIRVNWEAHLCNVIGGPEMVR